MVGFKKEENNNNMVFVKPGPSVNGPPKIKRKIKEEQKNGSTISDVASKINPWANLD